MGAIDTKKVSLFVVCMLVVVLVWLLARPTSVHAGDWRTQGRWHENHELHDHFEDDEYDYYDKSESSCDCDEDNENIDGDPGITTCDDSDDPSDDPVQGGGDQAGDDQAGDPNDPQTPAEPELELRVDQKVSVDGKPFVDAEDQASMPSGEIGDPVVWQVTVAADQLPEGEDRSVVVEWEKPVNVDVVSHQATSGSFDGTNWEVSAGNLPAVLTIDAVLNGSGLGASTARISQIKCDSGDADEDGYCDFNDSVSQNNSNPAGVVASTTTTANPGVLGASTTSKPTQAVTSATSRGGVLGDSTLSATGHSVVFAWLMGAILVLVPFALRSRI